MGAEDVYKILEQQHKADGSAGDIPRPPLFPRGAAASPDARYIFQSCDAAKTLLHICVDSLHPGGALPYLQSRFLLWFTYAAIVLLKVCRAQGARVSLMVKALYSGAMLRADHAETLKIIYQLCASFNECSKDSIRGCGLPQCPIRFIPNLDLPCARSTSSSGVLPLSQRYDLHATIRGTPTRTTSQRGIQSPPGGVYGQTQQNAGVQGQGQNNLGFTVLEDWFGQGLEGDDSGAVFGGLDLQDFWMKVGSRRVESLILGSLR